MALYESDFSKFMRKNKLENPTWQDEQDTGRALLSDKKINWTERALSENATVTPQAYPYDVNFKKRRAH